MRLQRFRQLAILVCLVLSLAATLLTYIFYVVRVHGSYPSPFGGHSLYRGWPLHWIVESRLWWSLDEYSDTIHFEPFNFLVDFVFWAVVFQLPSVILLLLRTEASMHISTQTHPYFVMLYCPRCGKKVPDDASYCSYCGTPIGVPKRSDLLTAGSILAIVAAGCSLIGGVLSIEQWFGYSGSLYPMAQTLSNLAFLGVLGIIGFISGLCAGILALKRQRFSLTVVALAMLILYSLVSFYLAWAVFHPYSVKARAFEFYGRFIGVPVFTLSLLSGIFIGAKRKEFAFPKIPVENR